MRKLLFAVAALSVTAPAVAWSQPPALMTYWPCPRAMGMVLGEDGTLYVASVDSRVYRFTTDGASLGYWGSYGGYPWSTTQPTCVALDKRGRIFVTELIVSNDQQTHLQVFTTDGDYIASWGVLGPAYAPAWLYGPFGVAVGPDSCLYVADTSIPRIQVFGMDGTFMRLWPTPGTNFGLAIDPAGNVYLADANGNRIRKFTSDGTLLREWGVAGSGPGEFNRPHNLALDRAGHVFVADTYNHRIQVFTGDGDYLTQWGSYGLEPGQFYRPMGVLVDASDMVYVADTWNGRIQKFGPVPTPARRTTWGEVKRRFR